MTLSESAVAMRLADHANRWGVVIDETMETNTSAIAFGIRDRDAVVLKVVKSPGDEWNAGKVLQAFGGRGVVRAFECVPGAMLVERLRPGTALVELSSDGRDDEATDILAGVMHAMSPNEIHTESPGVADWGRSFARYAARYAPGSDPALPQHLVDRASETFDRLVQTQVKPRLLHGDLQHYNVLFDDQRGWVAVDPKGVIGEREYEIGAILRNPVGDPHLFCSVATIERRIRQFEARLNVDPDRTLQWAFAQAVLSAIWSIEDGDPPQAYAMPIRLAEVLALMIR